MFDTSLVIGMLLAFTYGCFFIAVSENEKSVVLNYFLCQTTKLGKGLRMSVVVAASRLHLPLLFLALLSMLSSEALVSASQMKFLRILAYAADALLSLLLMKQGLRQACNVYGSSLPCSASLLILSFSLAHRAYAEGILLLMSLASGMTFTLWAIGLLTLAARRQYIFGKQIRRALRVSYTFLILPITAAATAIALLIVALRTGN